MSDTNTFRIAEARRTDFPALWPVMEPVIRAGETFASPRDWTPNEAEAVWFAPGSRVYAAWDRSGVVAADTDGEGRTTAAAGEASQAPAAPVALGCFYLKANGLGPAGHVANAGFMVGPQARGRGVGRALGRFALAEAARLGFRAMQFNRVVAVNTAALALWRSLGFATVGTVPEAFDHPTQGLVAVHVLYRLL